MEINRTYSNSVTIYATENREYGKVMDMCIKLSYLYLQFQQEKKSYYEN
jgi:hypothetical protein